MSPALDVTASPRAIVAESSVTRALGIVSFAILTALAAKTALPLPFTPVPITLQTLFVLLAGVYLGGKDGAASQITYVAMGMLGLPVFAGPSAGPAYILGPTGGFLLAFPIAAWVAGTGFKPGDGVWRTAGIFALALLLVLASGATWLARAIDVEAERAIALGVFPFLPGAALKVSLAAALASRQRPRG